MSNQYQREPRAVGLCCLGDGKLRKSWLLDLEKEHEDTAKAFAEMRNAVYRGGALDLHTKELISIAASVLMRCGALRCTQSARRNTAQRKSR